MKTYDNLTFEEFSENDIDLLTSIMKCAFDKDTKIHLGRECGGPPGYDNGDFLRRYGLHEASTSYKISKDGQIIGAVILWINADTNKNFLGNLFIDPKLENKGIGKSIWSFIEHEFPNTEIWCTETPIYSHRNHNFYINKCGFHVVKIENPKDIENGSFILEKKMK